MTPLEFLQTVWPENGIYCLAFPFTPKGQSKSVYRHKMARSIKALAEVASIECRTQNTFFCVHTLKEEKVWNETKINKKTGEKGAWEYRTQANMAEAKCFFFDLDVGDDEKKFASQGEALLSLKSFCEQAQLPKPMVVNSGGGLHVYWLLTEPLASPEWAKHAAKLRALAQHFDLKCDPMRTTDTASVLRVAGTFNLKGGNKRDVTVIMEGVRTPTGEFIKLLDDAMTRNELAVNIFAGKTKVKDPNELEWEDNLSKNNNFGPPPTLEAVAKACPQMARLVDLGGNVSEPEWYVSLNLARFTENGRERCHDISMLYDYYDPDETDAKIDQLEGRGLGPSTCRDVAKKCGEKLCFACPHWPKDGEKGSSPLVFARYADEAPAPVVEIQMPGLAPAAPVVIAPPRGFKRLKNGGISSIRTNNQGDEEEFIVISDIDLYPLGRQSNTMLDIEQQLWRVKLPREGEKDFKLDADALYDRNKFIRAIAHQGIYPSHANIPFLQDYMVSYIKELQRLVDAEKQNNHLGWVDDGKGFILPNRILTKDGVKPASMSLAAHNATEHVDSKGTLAAQVKLMEFYNHPFYLPHQFFLMCGLASPLFFASGYHGVLVNAHGETGASKSTALYTAAAFWGHPDLYTINGTKNGMSTKARNERIATLANLPICIDEITHMPPHEAADMVMYITQPTGRITLNQDRTERKSNGAEKATIALSTSNATVHGMLASNQAAGTAGAMRLIELTFEKHGKPHTIAQADEYLHDLRNNYGHIGEVFAAYLVQNREAAHEEVRKLIRAINTRLGSESGERFWVGNIAVVVVTTRIARSLGLVPYDPEAILEWAITKQLPSMRGVVKEEYARPETVLTDYIQLISGDTLVVEKTNNPKFPYNAVRSPRGQLLARYEPDTKLMYVLKQGFISYCIKSCGANGVEYLKKLNQPSPNNGQMIVTSTNKRVVLGKGTSLDTGQAYCFVVNMDHPEIKGSLDPAQEEKKPHLRVVS